MLLNIRDSFWFVPTLYSIASLILVISFHIVDELVLSDISDKVPKNLVINEQIAKGIYSSLVTAILTMTTISFSVIMVVLSTYSSQFSPRTLQDFMQSRMTHHVLGVFCFGFIFALVNLMLVGQHDTIIGPLLMIIISILCLAFFIFFIHHAAKWLQVSSLIGIIHTDSKKVIEHAYSEQKFGEFEKWDERELNQITSQKRFILRADTTGYIQKIEWMHLVNWAKSHRCVIELNEHIGNYVMEDLPLLSIYSVEQQHDINKIREFIVIGAERTDLEDIEFILQKLVEIAVKALSPSINDPDTAINCINRIGSILNHLGKVYKDIRYLTDNRNDLRLIKSTKQFDEYFYKSILKVFYYGKQDVFVCYSLLEVLYKMALANPKPAIRRKIKVYHHYISESINWNEFDQLDHEHLQAIYNRFEEVE
ncbi:DUF2254 domain-containing protein [Aquibacillus kalidii]|uniref:DUF2254 domain-containing protein n=1 Tax=Aquibacillus kalidii TaxID=2762597 RepID=UPI001C998496|nr:DUF2254 domain-containing protein [Aquibacillus kalidii]